MLGTRVDTGGGIFRFGILDPREESLVRAAIVSEAVDEGRELSRHVEVLCVTGGTIQPDKGYACPRVVTRIKRVLFDLVELLRRLLIEAGNRHGSCVTVRGPAGWQRNVAGGWIRAQTMNGIAVRPVV